MRESIKSLEKVFSDYAFNKKVLTAVRAELKLRTTKSAAALLQKVQQRLEEIEKRDRFGRGKPVKVTPPVTPPPSQLPLIEKPVAKPVRAERPTTSPPLTPRPQPIIINNPPAVTAPPPTKQDTQGKVRTKANIPLLIVIFTVIAFLFLWWWKLNTATELKRQAHIPMNHPVLPSRAEAPPSSPTAEGVQEVHDFFMREHNKKVLEWAKGQGIRTTDDTRRETEAFMKEADRARDERVKKTFEDYSGTPAAQRSNEGDTLTYEEIMRIKDMELEKIFGSSPSQNARYPEAAKPTDPMPLKERLDDYRNTVDALLN